MIMRVPQKAHSEKNKYFLILLLDIELTLVNIVVSWVKKRHRFWNTSSLEEPCDSDQVAGFFIYSTIA